MTSRDEGQNLCTEFPLEPNASITCGNTGHLLIGDKWTFTAKDNSGVTAVNPFL